MKRILFLILFSLFLLIFPVFVYGGFCIDDTWCSYGYRCSVNTCVEGCTYNSQCPIDKHYCLNNICSPCTDNSQCPEGYPCASGVCQSKSCQNAQQCGGDWDYSCIAQKCKFFCNADDECDAYLGPGYFCVGVGMSRACEKTSCSTDTECPSGFVCSNGNCKKPCNIKGDCLYYMLLHICDMKSTKMCEKTISCTTDTECQNFGDVYICSISGGSCIEDCTGRLCPQGYVCSATHCVSSPTCADDDECTIFGNYICDSATKKCVVIQEDCTINGCSDPAKPFCNMGTKKCEVKTCNVNYDCTLYSSCNNGICSPTKSCTTNAECNGYVCDTSGTLCYSHCINNNVPCDTASGYQCDATTQKCIKPLSISCTGDADCPFGEKCLGGQCSLTGTCSGDDDCTATAPKCKTDTKKCVQCLVDGDCNDGEVCTNNQCVQKTPPTEGCKSDADCPSGFSCDSGLCGATGTTACDSCPAGYVCYIESGNCKAVPEDKVFEPCNGDSCAPGLKCEDGLCKTPEEGITGRTCVELGGNSCKTGESCNTPDSEMLNSATAVRCCVPTAIGKNAECIADKQTFSPSIGGEVYIKRGRCEGGKREVYYCDQRNTASSQCDKETESCSDVSKRGSSTDIPVFDLAAGIVALIIIIVFYLFYLLLTRRKKKRRRGK